MLLQAEKGQNGYYIKLLDNNNKQFFSDMCGFDYGIDFEEFHDLILECNGKFTTFSIYDFPYFLSEKDAENFIELIELEMIMNKLVR